MLASIFFRCMLSRLHVGKSSCFHSRQRGPAGLDNGVLAFLMGAQKGATFTSVIHATCTSTYETRRRSPFDQQSAEESLFCAEQREARKTHCDGINVEREVAATSRSTYRYRSVAVLRSDDHAGGSSHHPRRRADRNQRVGFTWRARRRARRFKSNLDGYI